MASAARASADPDPQDGMFDAVLDNDLLLKALEKRQAAKDRLAPARKAYAEADAAARGMVAGLELEPGTVARCGRFRITHSDVAGRVVSFETEPTTRLSFGVIGE